MGTNGRRGRSLGILWFALVLVLTSSLSGLICLTLPDTALAAPAALVDVSVDDVLPGETSRIDIMVTNVGDDPGHDLSVTARVMGDVASAAQLGLAVTDPSVTPSFTHFDSATGVTTLVFDHLADLGRGEPYLLSFTVDTLGDPDWATASDLSVSVTAGLNDAADGSGTWYEATSSATGDVSPVVSVTKWADQSTREHQASGLTARTFTYTVRVRNNGSAEATAVVVSDAVPDGIEFLGMVGGASPDVGFGVQDPASGQTPLRWTLGRLDPGQTVDLVYRAALRYDHAGTALAGQPLGHGQALTNTADLSAVYKGSFVDTQTLTDADPATVRNGYITLDHSVAPASGGYGSTLNYTLTYATSEYYRTENMTMTVTVPDGQTYTADSASPVPSSVTTGADGTTRLVWNPADMGPSETRTITYRTTIDTTWESGPRPGDPIVVGDTMTTLSHLESDWFDLVETSRSGHAAPAAQVDAGVQTGMPDFSVEACDPDVGTWGGAVVAQVGDVVEYRLRFNTRDGATPFRKDLNSITYDAVRIEDLLPRGMEVTGSVTTTHGGTFTEPTGGSFPPPDPDTDAPFSELGRDGLTWFLGRVSPDGWWEATFSAVVLDVPAVAPYIGSENLLDVSWFNTSGMGTHSAKAALMSYVEPDLELDKSVTSPATGVRPDDAVAYRVTVHNTGSGTAEDVLISDTLPAGMRAGAPVVSSVTVGGTPLVAGVGYTTRWDGTSGAFEIDLHDGAVDSTIPAGGTLVAEYSQVVEREVVAGGTLGNIATVSWDTQPDAAGRHFAGSSDVADPNTDDAAVEIADLSIDKSTPTGPITIGDVIHYDITVTVPRGTVAYWPRILDEVTREDGLYHVAGSSTLTTSAGTPVAPAAFAFSGTPTRDTAGNDQTRFEWQLANPIDNRGQAQDYTFVLGYDMRYTGVSDGGATELFPPSLANDDISNDWVDIAWHHTDPGMRPVVTDDAAATWTGLVTPIDQPLVQAARSALPAGSYRGGQTITYEVSLTNVGDAPAHGITWTDDLSPRLANPVLVGQSVTSGTLGAGAVASWTAPTFSVAIADGVIDPGATLTLTYEATVLQDPAAGSAVTCAGDADWSSLPGAATGERVYDDQPWEAAWTSDGASSSGAVAVPTIARSIVSATPVRIGDTVRYRLRVTVPAETVLPAASLIDVVTRDGLAYTPGTAAIGAQSGSAESAAVLSGDAVFSDAPNPGSTLMFGLAADVDNASAAAGTGDAPYVFDVEYDMVYDGTTDAGGWTFFPPTATDRVTGTGSVRWTRDGATASASSGTGTLDVDQPRLTQSVTILGGAASYDGGDTVSYRAVISNPAGSSWARAYDLSWEDVLAPEMSEPALVSVTHSVSGDILGSVTPAFTPSTAAIDLDAVTLAVGESITIEYTAKVDPGAGSGSVQTNAADVDWASRPASPSTRVYADTAAEAAWTADTSGVGVQVETAGVQGLIESAVAARPIGEEFALQTVMSVPASTTAYDTVISQVVPDGMTVVSASRSQAIGTVSTTTVGGVTTVAWNVGDIQNPPTTTLTLTVRARVADTFTSGTKVDGLPAPADGDAASVLRATAEVDYTTASSGGSARHDEAYVDVTAQEPLLRIAQVASAPTVGPGEPVTFTVDVVNDGASAAHGVRFDTRLPAQLFAAGSSPTLTSVTLDGVPLAAGAGFTEDFGQSETSTVDVVPPMPVGSTLQLRYTAVLDGGVPRATALSTTASVREYSSMAGSADGERVSGPVSSATGLTTLAPVLTTAKTVVGDTHVQADGLVRYRVVVANTGDAPAHDFTVTDDLPAGLTYRAGSTSATWSGGSSAAAPVVSGSRLTWDLGPASTAEPGGSLVLEFEARVGASVAPGSIVNSATAAALDGGAGALSATSATATARVTRPSADVVTSLATGQAASVEVGDAVAFDIAITNTGDTTITTMPLLQRFYQAHLGFVGASPAQAETSMGKVRWADLTAVGGDLMPGSTRRVSATFEAVAVPAGGSTSSSATVGDATDANGDQVHVTATAASVTIQAASAATPTASASGYNDPLEYTRDNGYSAGPHGGYTTTTNKCRDCHSVHYAQGSYMLLRANSREAACDYCHGGGGGSAVNIQMDNDYDAESVVATQSMGFGTGHTLGYAGNAPVDVWPAYRDAKGLVCFDCHTPHGNSARTLATFSAPGRLAGEGVLRGALLGATLLDAMRFRESAVEFAATEIAADVTGESIDDVADPPLPSGFADRAGTDGDGDTSAIDEWMFWTTDFDGDGTPNRTDGDGGSGTLSAAAFDQLLVDAFGDYWVYWGIDDDKGNIVSKSYDLGDPLEGRAPVLETRKDPVFPKGTFLLIKNPDANGYDDAAAGDLDASGVIDNGETKLAVDWDRPLGPATTWGPIAISDDSSRFPLTPPWAPNGVAAEGEQCVDCHNGAAGSAGQAASVWMPSASDDTTGAYVTVRSHDANPRGCTRQLVVNPPNADGSPNADPAGGNDNLGPSCRQCHTGGASCQQCHGADGAHDYDPVAYIRTSASTTNIDGQCIDGGFSYPHRTLGVNLLKDSLWGVDFDGRPIAAGEARTVYGSTAAEVAASFGLPEDDYFGRRDPAYPDSWRADEIAGKPADGMDSVCIDCHGDATSYSEDATVSRDYLFGKDGPLDLHTVEGWELLLRGLP